MFAVADRLAVDVADAQALKAKAVRGDREALVGAAKQFESLLVSQMLKTMRQTRFSDEDDPFTGGDSLKLYQDLLDQQWATQLSKGRGLGFADMMVKALEKQAATVSAPQAASAAATPEPAAAQPVERAPDVPAPAEMAGGLPPKSVATSPSDPADIKAAFIARLRPHAEAAAEATGVPARFILAQAALESGWGQREIRTAEGLPSHNLFGIKAGRGWDGAVAETVTTEYRQGMPMKLAQTFRAYADYTRAFSDYAALVKRRYGAAVEAGDDAAAFAQGLAAGGYATDPAYAGKLQSVIARVAMAGA